jgi:cytochrome c oxidase subunit 2
MSGTVWRFVAVAALAAVTGYYAAAFAAAAPARIEVVASKFDFSAKEIRAKKGQPLTVVLRSTDFVHGFAVPDFNVRTDGIPGKTVELTFIPDKRGRFVFLCDNFCGEGHDRMSGFLVVTD